MSYLVFHALFVLPPIIFLLLGRKRSLPAAGRLAWMGLPLMSLLALVYTSPWDNYLVAKGVWDYGEDRVLGTLGRVPLEEYAFFVLQPILTGLWLYRLPGTGSVLRLPDSRPAAPEVTIRARWAGTSLCVVMALVGIVLLRWEPGFYLGLILAWSGPVLAGQWAYGRDVLWCVRRVWILGTLVPTFYLWAVDRAAIALGIWSISPGHTTGLAPFGLPVEEAVFFLVTNLMVVQGLLLFLWISGRYCGQRTNSPSRREDGDPTVSTAKPSGTAPKTRAGPDAGNATVSGSEVIARSEGNRRSGRGHAR